MDKSASDIAKHAANERPLKNCLGAPLFTPSIELSVRLMIGVSWSGGGDGLAWF